MADIEVRCSGCGSELRVSEYVDVRSLACPRCRQAIEVPAAARQKSALKVQEEAGPGERPKATVIFAPPPPPEAGKKRASRQIARPKKSSGRRAPPPPPTLLPTPDVALTAEGLRLRPTPTEAPPTPRAWKGWLAFAAVAFALVAVQFVSSRHPPLASVYGWVRLAVIPLVWILVVASAFNEGYLFGFLCLLLPPFTIYYAMSRTDSYVLRGLFFGVVLALGTEVYFVHDGAWVVLAQDWADRVILGGQGMIKEAGEAPVYKL